MNHQDCATVNADLKRPGRWSAAHGRLLGLAFMLALLLTGQAALAGEPIPGVDVNLGKNPGGAIVSAPTGSDGTFDFKGLAPGNYDLSVAGKFVKTLDVGSSRSVSGQLSLEPGGTGLMRINGNGATPASFSCCISIEHHDGVAGSSKAAPVPNASGMAVARPAEFKTAGEAPQKGGFKLAENESPTPTTRGVPVAVGDLNGDGRADSRTASPGKKDGEQGPAGPASGVAALAGEPIPGVDVKLGRNPGGAIVSAPTGPDGTFAFKGLAPGNYELLVGGKFVNTLTVGSDGLAGGRLMKNNNGTVSIFDRWGNSMADINSTLSDVSTSRLKTQGDAGAKPGQDAQGQVVLPLPTVEQQDKGKSAVAERFGNRGVSGFGSGAGPGGLTPPIPSPVRAGPSPMGPGPMGPGAMGGGAMRK